MTSDSSEPKAESQCGSHLQTEGVTILADLDAPTSRAIEADLLAREVEQRNLGTGTE